MITKTGNWYDQSMDNSNNEWFYNIYIMSNNCEKLLKQILLLVYKHNNLIFYFVSKLLILRYYQITKKKKEIKWNKQENSNINTFILHSCKTSFVC